MTDKPDLDHLRQWIGRSEQASDIVTAQLVKGLRATLFMEIGRPKPGDAAPFTVHWCLAQPVYPMSELSADGHPTRGGCGPAASSNFSIPCVSATRRREPHTLPT